LLVVTGSVSSSFGFSSSSKDSPTHPSVSKQARPTFSSESTRNTAGPTVLATIRTWASSCVKVFPLWIMMVGLYMRVRCLHSAVMHWHRATDPNVTCAATFGHSVAAGRHQRRSGPTGPRQTLTKLRQNYDETSTNWGPLGT
jgi:hypothetical protein